ncbi:class I SAM-dependent methyltransferase [Tabrizicola sp. J26]|uniref:class I SAM-dependent methyltransferase n=1 Tax=Alitabrizicola rongguiensis TaxID=2909234 RepID=UPI001F1F5421|nr:class I SAM-dependent methyltransferase [Tabrizicola rongguiensis]MCF1708563.1 class I SAM-dependent methyltransferase [Tabrizicola rongguiensis]
MAQTANDGQADFWNADPGRNWVLFQPDMDLILAEVAAEVFRQAAPAPGERVIDIGCGAGTTTLEAARRVGAAGRALGLDISHPLLERAEERRRDAGLANLAFLHGDAQVHPFEPAGTDLILSRFGVMFFADPVAAFRNMASALRPGGRMVFAVWSNGQVNPFFSTPGRIAAERLGPPEVVDPDGPGPMALRDPARVLHLFNESGMVEAEVRKVPLDLHHPGGVDRVVTMLGRLGGIPGILREKGGTAEDLAAILAGVREAFAGYATPDGIRIPAEINLCTAVKS